VQCPTANGSRLTIHRSSYASPKRARQAPMVMELEIPPSAPPWPSPLTCSNVDIVQWLSIFQQAGTLHVRNIRCRRLVLLNSKCTSKPAGKRPTTTPETNAICARCTRGSPSDHQISLTRAHLSTAFGPQRQHRPRPRTNVRHGHPKTPSNTACGC